MIDEYKEALDELRFSPEAKRRMVQRIEVAVVVEPLPRPTRRSRALVIAAAAAVLALAVGCTAYLAGAFVSLEDFAEDLFGGAPSQTEVIDKIGRPIGASAVSNGVAITADAVIGDNEHCVAVFSIARTDGMPIEGVDTILDKSFTTVFTGAQLFRVGNTKVGPEYCFYDADPSDNSVQCIVKMTSFIGGDSFIGKIMHVELGDLATGEMTADGKTTLPSLQTVIEGSWDMSFPLNYEDASIELSAGQRTKLDGIDVAIDSVVLSHIAIVVEYTADEPLMTKDEETGKRRGSAGIDVPITVNLRNGSSIDVPSVGAMNDGGATKRRADLMFDKILDLDQVKSVTVGGVEIPMP